MTVKLTFRFQNGGSQSEFDSVTKETLGAIVSKFEIIYGCEGSAEVDFSLTEGSLKHTSLLGKGLYNALKSDKNTSITKFTFSPENLFTLEQKKEIDQILSKNAAAIQSDKDKATNAEKAKKQTQERQTSNRGLKNALFFGVISIFLVTFNPFIAISVTLSVVIGLSIGVLAYLKVKIESFSAHNFYEAEQIKEIKNVTEKEAYIAGADAKTWTGYLVSFANYKAYLHPFAYGAGLTHAFENNSEIIENVKKLHIKS